MNLTLFLVSTQYRFLHCRKLAKPTPICQFRCYCPNPSFVYSNVYIGFFTAINNLSAINQKVIKGNKRKEISKILNQTFDLETKGTSFLPSTSFLKNLDSGTAPIPPNENRVCHSLKKTSKILIQSSCYLTVFLYEKLALSYEKFKYQISSFINFC